MSTETFNPLYLILQLLIWGAMLATLWVYVGQLRQMRAGATGQNILSLVNFLQATYVRDARTVVRQRLRDIPYKDWTAEDKRAADMVCSTYDIAAILILELKLVPAEPFLKNWAASIQDCYGILLPHVTEMQKTENSGPGYWDDFGQLYKTVLKGQ